MKRFYNNTLIGGAFSKALRVVALLCVLLGVSTSAWGETYYLWYGSNDNYNNNSYQWSDGVSFSNNKGTFTINTSYWECYVYIAKGSKSKSNLLKTPNFAKPTTSTDVSNLYQGNRDGYNRIQFTTGTEASKSFTIECDFSNSSEYTFKVNTGSSSGGGAAACTPSATFTSAVLNGDKINLKGTFNSCEESVFYGWQWSNKLNQWNANNVTNENGGYVTSGNQEKVNTEKNYEFTIPASGTTYYFRTYMVVGTEWVFGTDVKSVKVSGSSSGDVVSGDCESIEIWCDKNYECYVFWNGQAIENEWPGKFGTKDNNDNYYKWTITGHDKVNVIFSQLVNSTRSQTGDIENLEKGYRYIFDNPTLNKDNKTCPEGIKISCEQPSTNVLLSREAIVNKSAKTAQLFGYLKSIKAPDCPESAITDYGFFYCMVNDGDTPCLPTSSSSTKIAADPSSDLSRGEEFTATVGLIKEPSDALQDGKTYYYRAYAKIDDKYILSGEIRSFSTDPCIPQYGGKSDKYNGKPIVYTINADPAFAANDCKLHFKSLQDAIVHLRNTANREKDYAYVTNDNGSYNLNQPVVMNVVYYDDTPENPASAYIYRGTENVGIYAGDNKPANANLIQDFNKSANADPANTLTIKAGTKVAKPWIHHLVIRNSRNIVLDSLCIYSDPNKVGDNALEIDVNSNGWDGMTTGQFADANIVIQNSMIGSDGFTGVHVSAYDGITFKKNDFEIVFEGNTDGNVLNWSASAKFMMCKNIKFIQNNFRGSQPTMLWLQECQNALFMNNVFWNTNTFVPADGSKAVVPSAVRLVSQYANEIDNIGFYYNTFYFANNDIDAPWAKYNFFNQYLAYTNGNQANINKYGSNIYFKYNNCYSYDKDCPGMYDVVGSATGDGAGMTYKTETATSDSENFCPNNFWSQYDQDKKDKGEDVTKSAFAFGCSDNDFVNVKGQVCETTASGPASLIVKGKGMDYGVKPDISTTGITLESNEQYADRYLIGARPADGEKWTYGAYQSKDNIDTKLIYWVGVTDDWDDRNNWEYETEVDGKMVRQRVSCVNNFSEDLKVVVEEIGTVEVEGGRKWPQIPASFTENRTNSGYAEHVSAGLGTGKTPTKFASTIELEYGAGIKGVENLREADGTLRYDRAITHFDAPRDKWLLVGTVVKPFENEKTGTTRNVISRDYYMDFLPQVYMRQTVVGQDEISWTKTFPDLDTEVLSTTVFAINAVNKYGPSFQEAVDYNAANGTNYDGTAPIPYTFTGRFAVEEERVNANDWYAFTITNTDGTNLLNNNYPCNLDAKALEDEEYGYGTVNVYNYEKGAFESTSASSMTGNVYIKAQNGFVFTPKNGQLKIEPRFLVEGSTRTRSVERELPTFSLNVDNANTTQPGASNVVIRYDQEQEAFFEAPLNTPKVFTKNLYTPEVYIINNDAFYSRLYVGNGVTQVPLGLRLLRAMNVTFQKVYNEQFTTMILVDTKTGKEYDLLARDYTTEKLPKDTIEGRFYLKFAVEEQDDFQEDDDFVTDITDLTGASINIYAVDQQIIKVIANDVELQTIYVNDMTGRMMRYDASGSYAELKLPVAQGVYLVHVIGDKATRTEKVILK